MSVFELCSFKGQEFFCEDITGKSFFGEMLIRVLSHFVAELSRAEDPLQSPILKEPKPVMVM